MTVSIKDAYVYHDAGADEEHRRVLTQHRDYLMSLSTTQRIAVTDDATPFYYNLFRYLKEQQYPSKLHWIIMVLSGLNSPEDFDKTTKTLIVPHVSEVEKILNVAGL